MEAPIIPALHDVVATTVSTTYLPDLRSKWNSGVLTARDAIVSKLEDKE